MGDAIGERDSRLGTTDTAQECIDLVTRKEPTANGITYVSWTDNSDDKACYAEFSATSIESQACEGHCQTCIFEQGRLLR